MTIFDYIFYRVAKFFYKKDGIDAFRAVCTVSMIQGITLGAIIFSIMRLVDEFPNIIIHLKGSGQIGIVVGIIFLARNYFRYKGKYWHFAERWKNTESAQQRKLRGVLVVIAILIPIFLVFWMGTSGYRL